MNFFRKRAKKHLKDERGSFSVEAVMMTPILVFGYMGMFVFFEGLRESNINLKAAYTVSDLLSRETDEIDMTYLNGMNAVFGWLTRSQNPVQMRVTVVRWDEDADRHTQIWSRGVNGKPDLTQAEVDTLVTPNVPILADASTAIVVETWATYTPVMDLGLDQQELYNMIVTPPRFAEQLKFEGVGDGGGTTHDDQTPADEGL